MKQFEINRSDLSDYRIVEAATPEAGEEEIMLKVEQFGLSANNITYAVAGDTLGYWQFFNSVCEDTDQWGVMPVWGFAEVVDSNVDEVPKGERLFGYFPPATHMKMKPVDIAASHLFDGSEHRSALPKGYNVYRRVAAEPGYDGSGDDMRMLLFPLYVTSFVLWDQLQEHEWYGAQQVILVSASSKTSIGLAYALQEARETIELSGLTSSGNAAFVKSLNLYDHTISYDDLGQGIERKPTVIVDMAGNADVLGGLHLHLGENMKHTLSVGLTHWEAERRSSDVIKERTEFFFAPSRIQRRMKDWGASEFNARSNGFVLDAANKSREWLNLKTIDGLEGLQAVYADVLNGKANPADGLLIDMRN